MTDINPGEKEPADELHFSIRPINDDLMELYEVLEWEKAVAQSSERRLGS